MEAKPSVKTRLIYSLHHVRLEEKMIGKRKVMIVVLVVGLAAALWADDGADPEPGLLISRVVEDSPAERAGLIRGDILLEIDGKEVESPAELREILSEYKAGQRATLLILRGGNERDVTVTLEERLYRPALGLEFSMHFGGGLGFPHMEFFGGTRLGVIIVDVIEDSPADKAGLEPMDAILSIDGEQVPPHEFSEIIAGHSPGERVTLEVSRRGEEGAEPFEVTVRLGENDDGGGFLGIRYSRLPLGSVIGPEFRDHFKRGFRDRRDDDMRGIFRYRFPLEEGSDI